MSPKILYFYKYDKKWYWGTYYKWQTVFRSKPIRLNHYYTSHGMTFRLYWVSASQYNAPGMMVEIIYKSRIIHFGLNPDELSSYNIINDVYSSWHKTDVQRRDFRNFFRNRMMEYFGKYFIPLEKRSSAKLM